MIEMLMKCYPNQVRFSVSHTTRPMRPGEVDGEDYRFVDDATFSTMVDEEAVSEPKGPGTLSRMSEAINRRLDASAERRMERRVSKASKKAQSKDSSEGQWSAPASSSLTRSVVSCGACGALNNSGTPYCTSCGEFLT